MLASRRDDGFPRRRPPSSTVPARRRTSRVASTTRRRALFPSRSTRAHAPPIPASVHPIKGATRSPTSGR
jgi:hypothetical protein